MRLGPAVRIAPVLFRPNPVLVEHQALPEREGLGKGEQLFTPYGPCPRIAPPCSGMGGCGNRSPGLHGPRRVEGPGSRARARTHPHAQFPVRPEELAAGTANLWPNGGSQVQGNQPVPVAGADHRAGLAADVLVPRLAPCRCSCSEACVRRAAWTVILSRDACLDPRALLRRARTRPGNSGPLAEDAAGHQGARPPRGAGARLPERE